MMTKVVVRRTVRPAPCYMARPVHINNVSGHGVLVTGKLIEQIRGDRRLSEALEETFDFIVGPPEHDSIWFRIEPADRVEPIASDAAGGVFLLYGPDERVVYVSSEGQAGVVARTLREFLSILVTYPYWFDLLKFSGGGKLEEMQSAVEPLEEQAAEHAPHLDKHRQLLSGQLGLQKDPAVVGALHAAVRDLGHDVRVLGPDGSECESLFNKFSAACLRPPRPGL